ncbi:MAG TPA: lytic transglycosylase domain-containing protein [Blastocatellia bacterium]|nr:lytic transglycosylase domain-containing protein [Blastocatellia bacterium]
MGRLFSTILIVAALSVWASAQQQPMSPPEKSPVPLRVSDADPGNRTEAEKKKTGDEKVANKILVPTTLAGHHISSGNPAIDLLVQEAASRNGLDPCLIISVMRAESGFNKSAISPKGASGLMQLMPETAARFGVRNIFDPRENILGGATYLRWLLDRFGGDVRLALAGYNAGEGSVEIYGNRIPPFLETQNYVRTIYTKYSTLHLGRTATTPVSAEAAAPLPKTSPSENVPTYNQIIRFTSSSGDKSGK